MRAFLTLAALLLPGALLLSGPALAEPSATILPLPFAVAEFRSPASYAARVLPSLDAVRARRPAGVDAYAVAWGEGQAAGLYLAGGEVRLLAFPLPGDEEGAPFGESPPEATPGTRQATAGPFTAYLTNPAEGGDSPFGEVAGSRELVINERKPVAPGGGVQRVAVESTRVEAGPGASFMDVEPRLADLDGDGTPEIILVRQTSEGASLAIIARRDGRWRIAAETPPVSGPDPWLNPAAIGAFSGRGRPEIAVVRSPHADGVLQVWAYEGGKLVLRHEKPGYSTHALGSAALDLAASADLDGDRLPDLALPSLDRGSLVLISLKDGIREIGRVALPSPVSRGVAALGAGRDARLLVALEDGRLAVVRP